MLIALVAQLAFGLDCAEVKELHDIGVPEDVIVEEIENSSLTPADAACVAEAGLSLRIQEAARRTRATSEAPLDAPEPATDPGSPQPAAKECFPPCSPGYLCHLGACIEACNPTCGAGTRCSADRTCVSDSGTGEPAAEAHFGQLCVFRAVGPMNRWEVDMDGIRIGLLNSNKHVCVEAPSGLRRVTLTQVIGGTGWMVDSQKEDPTVTVGANVPAGVLVGLLCDARVSAFSTHLECQPLSAAQVRERLNKRR